MSGQTRSRPAQWPSLVTNQVATNLTYYPKKRPKPANPSNNQLTAERSKQATVGKNSKNKTKASSNAPDLELQNKTKQNKIQ